MYTPAAPPRYVVTPPRRPAQSPRPRPRAGERHNHDTNQANPTRPAHRSLYRRFMRPLSTILRRAWADLQKTLPKVVHSGRAEFITEGIDKRQRSRVSKRCNFSSVITNCGCASKLWIRFIARDQAILRPRLGRCGFFLKPTRMCPASPEHDNR